MEQRPQVEERTVICREEAWAGLTLATTGGSQSFRKVAFSRLGVGPPFSPLQASTYASQVHVCMCVR